MSKGFLVTVEELEQHPNKLETKMRNLANIALWKKHYSGKRSVNGIQLKPWRDKIERIEREIKATQRQTKINTTKHQKQQERLQRELDQYNKFHERVVQFYYAIVDKCSRFKQREQEQNFDTELFMSVASRTLGNDIHDFTEVKTGLMTLDCFKAKQSKSKLKPTPEHFWPRSVVGGRDILEQALVMGDKFSLRHVIRTLFELCQTVESLNVENRTLMKYQKHDTFVSPQIAYDSAGIRLVRVKDFTLHSNWSRIFEQYGIVNINPYEFSNILTVEEAESI